MLLGARAILPPPYSEPAPVSVGSSESSFPSATTMVAPLPALPKAVDMVEVEQPTVIELPAPIETKQLTYRVLKGDSLWKIARMYGVTHQELANTNKIAVDSVLKVGTVLQISPGGQFVPPEKRPKIKPRISKRDKAVKKKGAKAVAKRTVKTAAAKKMSLPKDGKYAVKSGDSLWIVARRFGLKTNDIRTLNNLNTDVLQVGQVLLLKRVSSGEAPTIIPEIPVADDDAFFPLQEKKTEAAVPASVIEGTPLPAPALAFPKTLEHTVGPEDTLEIIANMYDTTVEEIKRANPTVKTAADLAVNKKILVPYH